MAVPRLRVPPVDSGTTLRNASDEVELYHRTYTTLLRSSGETMLRVLEPSHAAMNSSLHALAHDMESPDLGAFLYSLRPRPAGAAGTTAGRGRWPSCWRRRAISTTRSRRSSPTSSSGTSCTRCCDP